MSENRLLMLTGPSCAGKSPLIKALTRQHPDWAARIKSLVLYNSRDPRPNEVDGIDYHFRERDELERMQMNPDCVCMDVRGDFQVLDIAELKGNLLGSPILFEGNPFIAKTLQTDPRLDSIPKRSVFLSPLSREEIVQLKQLNTVDIEESIAGMMRDKLIRRTLRQKGNLSEKDLLTIAKRSRSAWGEIQMAGLFDHVVVNHDGEDSDNWFMPILIGEARLATAAVYAGLTGSASEKLENWNGLFD